MAKVIKKRHNDSTAQGHKTLKGEILNGVGFRCTAEPLSRYAVEPLRH